MSEDRLTILRRLAREPGRTPAESAALITAAALLERAFIPPAVDPDRQPDYYRLEPVWEWRLGDRGSPGFQTAASVTCAITGKALAGMGGPALAIDPALLTGALRADGATP